MSTRAAQKRAQEKKDRAMETRAMLKAQSRKLRAMEMQDSDPVKKQIVNSGGHGVEALSNKNEARTGQVVEASLPNSTSILQVTVVVSDRAISYLAMGIVLRAIKRGLMSAQRTAETPYYMFRYLIDAFRNAMLSGVSLITEAPMWYWEIFHALKPKLAKFKTASIQYKWRIAASGFTDSQDLALGAGPDFYVLWWGTGVSQLGVNGFPVLGALGTPYTPDLGLAAIATLWPFCSSTITPLIPDPGNTTSTFADTSAFAINYPELGASFATVGGFRSTIYSERHIDSPLFAKFAEYQPAGSADWRGWHKSGLACGSSSMVGPYLIDVQADKPKLRNKISPTVKIYNFDEIFEQLSLIMCIASENLLISGQSPPVLQLTSQQVQILLRQAILNQFDNDMFQDLRYDSNDRIHLIPFTVGPNGSVSATVDMLVPTFLAENIRCMKQLSANSNKKYKNAIIQWYSVLARPPQQAFPQLGNYSYGPANTLLYVVDPAEVPINIIDVSATLNQNTVYLDVSRQEIQSIKEVWNAYISKMTSVLSPLVSITAEKGIRCLNCNLNTNSVQYNPPPPQPLVTPATIARRKSVEQVKSVGISATANIRKVGATPAPGSSYFDVVVDNETTSVEAIKPPTWPILSKWVLPVDFANDQIEDSSIQGVRAFQVEPFNIPRCSAGGIGGTVGQFGSRPDSFSRHLTAAQVDTKAFATLGQNEIIQALIELSKSGRGGFLTSLVSNMVNTFSPQAASVISAVGNMVGI